MDAHHEQDIHWGWLLAFYLLIVALLFIFGDLLTAIVGTIVQSVIFASYYNAKHAEH
ncbi:MAG: hypothetical protein ACK4GN_16780 [Runella sp.]